MELKRCGVQCLASVIAADRSLIKFKKDSSKGQNKKTGGNGKSAEDWDKSPRWEKPSVSKDKRKGKKDEMLKKISCFLSNGLHRVFECLKQGNLTDLIQEEER